MPLADVALYSTKLVISPLLAGIEAFGGQNCHIPLTVSTQMMVFSANTPAVP